MLEKNMTLKDKLTQKEDQYFEIARDLVAAKEGLVTLEVELDGLKEERQELLRRSQELEYREEDVARLNDEIEYKEKLLDELEER